MRQNFPAGLINGLVEETQSVTYENLLLTLPNRNRTNPVTMHAALNRVSLPSAGNEVGMITYPSRGNAPKVAKEQNMTKPRIEVLRSIRKL